MIRKIAIVIFLCTSMTSCSVIQSRLQGDTGDQQAVARAVKADLIGSDVIDAAPLRVRVDGQNIVLTGFVDSEDESQAAEKLTREGYPDYFVINDILVK